MPVTIVDASTGRHVTGSLVKRYPKGVTIDDARQIRHYATLDRVVSGLEPDKPLDYRTTRHTALFERMRQ
jgi:hypothetical protein